MENEDGGEADGREREKGEIETEEQQSLLLSLSLSLFLSLSPYVYLVLSLSSTNATHIFLLFYSLPGLELRVPSTSEEKAHAWFSWVSVHVC